MEVVSRVQILEDEIWKWYQGYRYSYLVEEVRNSYMEVVSKRRRERGRQV
jgi:hypothetical protein